MLKVLFVLDSLGAGGAERSTALLVPRLKDLGVECAVVVLVQRAEGFEASVRSTGVPVLVLRPKSRWRQVRELRRIIRSMKPDILHTSLYWADQIGRVASIGLPILVVSSLVNVPRSHQRLDGGRVAALKRWCVDAVDMCTAHAFVDHFHAVTEGVARLYVESYRLDRSRVSVVERGRDRSELGERTQDRRLRIRAGLAISASAPVFIAVGRHEPQKAHLDLLDAFELLLADHDDAILLLAGREGTCSGTIAAKIRESERLNAQVHVLGHRSDVSDLIAAADAMVQASRFEGAAGAVLEGMALETPVVSTKLVGLEGVLEDHRNSILVEVGDVKSLATAMSMVIENPELAARLGGTAKADFELRFSAQRSAEEAAKLYRSLIQNLRPAIPRDGTATMQRQ